MSHRRMYPLRRAATRLLRLEFTLIDLLKWAALDPTLRLHHLRLQALRHTGMEADMAVTLLEIQSGQDPEPLRDLFQWSLLCPLALLLVVTDLQGQAVEEDSWQALTTCFSRPRPPCQTKDDLADLALILLGKCSATRTSKFWPEET